MTTITRARLEYLTKYPEAASKREAIDLVRIALSAMDSEPVGEFYEDGPLNWYQISDGDRVPANRRIPLYRHAQPVPDVKTTSDFVDECGGNWSCAMNMATAWNACRAAMLNGGKS